MVSKYEVKARKELQKSGYTVDWKSGMGRFATNRDFFHLFDIIAVKKEEKLRFISIKGHAGAPKWHQRAIKDFWFPTCCQKEIWYWPKNKKKKAWIRKIVS